MALKTKNIKDLTRIQCLHPEGKKAPSIKAETYALFEKAIRYGLRNKKTLTFSELTEEIEKYFAIHNTPFKGSIGWYAVIVKNHMESIGIIMTFTEKGRKLHSLA